MTRPPSVVTSETMWSHRPDSQLPNPSDDLSMGWSIVTVCLSGTVMEIWHLKDNGVTTLTFWGHVTSSVTERKMEEGKKKEEGGGKGKGKGK